MEKCGQYRAKFGEGPIWHKRFGLIWLDISHKKIVTYDPVEKKEFIYDSLGWIKALIPTTDNQFIGVYKEGLYYLNFQQGTKKPFAFPEGLTDIHYLNDAKCGPDGKIWVGSSDGFFKRFKESPHTAMSQYPFENAKLFSVDVHGKVRTQLKNVGLSNGLDWDRKSNKLYHVDSSTHSISQYAITAEGGVEYEKNVYTFKVEEGFPNGMTIDNEGNLWVALFKGGLVALQSDEPTRILCIDPSKMEVKEEIIVPVSHATSCTIGGENLDTLFITTAYEPLLEERVRKEPLAGYLLQVPIKVKGVAHYLFSMKSGVKSS